MSQSSDLSILRERLNQLAMEFVAGASDAAGPPAWTRLLGDFGAEAAALGNPPAAARCAALLATLSELSPDSAELADAADAGIRDLEKLLDASAADAPPAVPPRSPGLADSPELVADFVMESREHLQSIVRNVLALEQDASAADPIHAIFRAFHTVKGIAGFLEFEGIRSVSHETETLLDAARNGRLTAGPQIIDVILESADYIEREIARIESGAAAAETPAADLVVKVRAALNNAAGPALQPDLASLSRALQADRDSGAGPAAAQPDAAAPAVQALPDPPPVVAPAKPAPAAATEPPAALQSKAVSRSVKVDTAKLDFLIDMVGEMVIAQSLVRHSPELASAETGGLARRIAALSRITDEVQKTAMSMRMVPVGMLFQKMERLVRDLSRKAGKETELVTSGADTELDRNIVEELADPLMHMVRNALDHGIETHDERARSGKPALARVELRASHDAGHVVIEIADDGRGMDREKILHKALEKGIVSAGQTLSDNEVFQLIFEPGFSTAEKVTDISGRGVGMDVVKRQIQKLRGRIEIATEAGRGSRFRLRLPLTLAIIDGLIVAVGEEQYIVPIFAVKEALRPAQGVVSTMENRREIAQLRGRVLPVIRLSQRFGVPARYERAEESVLIVTESQETEYCLMVDGLVGKQEVVIKSLGETMRHVQGVAGGAILGDGRIGLILDMNALFHTGGR